MLFYVLDGVCEAECDIRPLLFIVLIMDIVRESCLMVVVEDFLRNLQDHFKLVLFVFVFLAVNFVSSIGFFDLVDPVVRQLRCFAT